MSSNSRSVSVLITPACRNRASTVRSERAMNAPVHDAAGAGGGPRALDGHDRLGHRDPTGDPPEIARVPERVDVEHQDSPRRVLPVFEEVVGREVDPVADRDQRREPEAACCVRSTAALPNPPLCVAKPTSPREWWRERRSRQARSRAADSRRRGSQGPPSACPPPGRSASSSSRRVRPAGPVRETGGQDDQRADALGRAARATSTTAVAGTTTTASSTSPSRCRSSGPRPPATSWRRWFTRCSAPRSPLRSGCARRPRPPSRAP